MTSNQEFTPVAVVCTGYGATKDGKELVIFQPLQDDGSYSVEEWALLRRNFKASPGNVYILQRKENSFKQVLQWQSQYARHDEAAAMQAAATAYDLERRAAAIAKREGGPTATLESDLQKLRRVYVGLRPMDRLPFELWLLSYLRQR